MEPRWQRQPHVGSRLTPAVAGSAPLDEASPARICISGPLDGSRRPGLLTLAAALMDSGFDEFVIWVEELSSMNPEGALALMELLQRFSMNGSEAHLALSSVERPLPRDARLGTALGSSRLGRPSPIPGNVEARAGRSWLSGI